MIIIKNLKVDTRSIAYFYFFTVYFSQLIIIELIKGSFSIFNILLKPYYIKTVDLTTTVTFTLPKYFLFKF